MDGVPLKKAKPVPPTEFRMSSDEFARVMHTGLKVKPDDLNKPKPTKKPDKARKRNADG
jgi:hypothetical protein